MVCKMVMHNMPVVLIIVYQDVVWICYSYCVMIDGQQLSVSNYQYHFIGSETLIQNGELLRLLETK